MLTLQDQNQPFEIVAAFLIDFHTSHYQTLKVAEMNYATTKCLTGGPQQLVGQPSELAEVGSGPTIPADSSHLRSDQGQPDQTANLSTK